MTTTPTTPLTLDAAPEIAAIREALALGPTPGPWLEKGRAHASGECIRIESHHASDDHHLYQVADVLDANDYPINKVNLAFILACNPAAMTAVLATIAQLEARLRETEAVIRDHNAGCETQCEQRQQNGTASCPYAQYGRQCTDCPRDWLLDAAIAAHGKDGA